MSRAPIQRDASCICGRVMPAGRRGQARGPFPAPGRRCVPWLEFVVEERLLVGWTLSLEQFARAMGGDVRCDDVGDGVWIVEGDLPAGAWPS
jgi:hypothetical protein